MSDGGMDGVIPTLSGPNGEFSKKCVVDLFGSSVNIELTSQTSLYHAARIWRSNDPYGRHPTQPPNDSSNGIELPPPLPHTSESQATTSLRPLIHLDLPSVFTTSLMQTFMRRRQIIVTVRKKRKQTLTRSSTPRQTHHQSCYWIFIKHLPSLFVIGGRRDVCTASTAIRRAASTSCCQISPPRMSDPKHGKRE